MYVTVVLDFWSPILQFVDAIANLYSNNLSSVLSEVDPDSNLKEMAMQVRNVLCKYDPTCAKYFNGNILTQIRMSTIHGKAVYSWREPVWSP